MTDNSNHGPPSGNRTKATAPSTTLSPTSSRSDAQLDADTPAATPSEDFMRRDYKFALVFVAIGISTLITALELSAVSAALPVITADLHADSFVWVGSAYTLAATTFIPVGGGLAQVFGRRGVMFASLALMTLGSALCGAADSMNFLIGARTVQGLGGGGIAATTAIIISDLVPLAERGVFNGYIGIAWSLGSGIGPIVGGALARANQWRWLFYLNIPICGLAAVLFLLFLKVRTPPGTIAEKFKRMDWGGMLVVVGSTTSTCIALTWSGVQFAWSSPHVLVPLIVGLIGLVAWLVYEEFVPRNPLVPFSLMSTRTGMSGYLQTFFMPICMLAVVYYIPVYFQACHGDSPLRSGVYCLPFALLMAPTGLVSGVSITKTQSYRAQLWAAWVLTVVGLAAMTTLKAGTGVSSAMGFLALLALGPGILVTGTYFPVLAPLPVSSNGPALAFFMFLRNFAQVWGVTIGGTVLQNQLTHRLPPAFLALFPSKAAASSLAFSSIPTIAHLDEPLRTQVREAFAESLRVLWFVLLGIAVLGLVSSAGMKALPLHTRTDRTWELERAGKAEGGDGEGGSAEKAVEG